MGGWEPFLVSGPQIPISIPPKISKNFIQALDRETKERLG